MTFSDVALWPTATDLADWLGNTYTETPDAAVLLPEAWAAADGLIRVWIDEDTLGVWAQRAYVFGMLMVTTDGSSIVPQGPDYICPLAVRQAILIFGGRMFTRRDTPLGVMNFGGERGTLLAKTDPDVYALIEPWTGVSV